MNLVQFRSWRLFADVELTREFYRAIPQGSAAACALACNDCRYFDEHRDRIFPPEFRELLERLGIDYTKEAESYSFSESAVCGDRAGWFHYAGRIEGVDADYGNEYIDGDFCLFIHPANALLQEPFLNHAKVHPGLISVIALEWSWPTSPIPLV